MYFQSYLSEFATELVERKRLNELKPECFLLILQDGKESVVKEVYAGDSVHSLLSILDVITVGHINISAHKGFTKFPKKLIRMSFVVLMLIVLT